MQVPPASKRHQPPDIVIQFNALLLDGHKVVIGDWRTNGRLLIIWDEDVGEHIGTGKAILSDGKIGDGFDSAKDTAHRCRCHTLANQIVTEAWRRFLRA